MIQNQIVSLGWCNYRTKPRVGLPNHILILLVGHQPRSTYGPIRHLQNILDFFNCHLGFLLFLWTFGIHCTCTLWIIKLRCSDIYYYYLACINTRCIIHFSFSREFYLNRPIEYYQSVEFSPPKLHHSVLMDHPSIDCVWSRRNR